MRGFTLFFAMLVSSLALAVGLAIFDLTIRELDLSATVTQSEYAIYAADTGIECALYWDNHFVGGSNNAGSNSAFATSSQDTFFPTSGITCNGQDIAAAAVTANTWPIQIAPNGPPTISAATTTFTITFAPQPYCASVTVAKSGNPSQTTIISHGYNTCSAGGLRLERALQVNY